MDPQETILLTSTECRGKVGLLEGRTRVVVQLEGCGQKPEDLPSLWKIPEGVTRLGGLGDDSEGSGVLNDDSGNSG